jgi:hypothetical protein
MALLQECQPAFDKLRPSGAIPLVVSPSNHEAFANHAI